MMRWFLVFGSLSICFLLTPAAHAQGEPPPGGPGAPPPPPPEAAPPPAPPSGEPAAPAPAAPAAAPQPVYGAPQPQPVYGAPPPAPPSGEPAGAHTHDGFYMRFALDFGPVFVNEKVTVNGNQAPGGDIKWRGFTLGYDFMFGGTPAPGFAIGGALVLTSTKNPDVEQGAFSQSASGTMYWAGLALFADFYPDPHGGAHILGMLGFSSISFVNTNGNSTQNSPSGILAGIGGGYEFWIGNQWSFGPIARLMYSSMSYENSGAKDSVSYLYPSIGIGITLH
jgi:Autotransporter beta-domain